MIHAKLTPAMAVATAPLPDAAPEAADANRPPFSPLEWMVISLARRDPLSSLETPTAMSLALKGVFGTARVSALANPRLEALRRMSVHAWRGKSHLPRAEIRQFLAAGFATPQLRTLLTSVRARSPGPFPFRLSNWSPSREKNFA